MSKLDIEIPHQLPKEEALSRIKNLLVDLQRDHKDMIKNVSDEWHENEGNFSFNAKGFDISGKIRVDDVKVSLKGDLPFMLSFFKSQISNVIKERAGKLLAN